MKKAAEIDLLLYIALNRETGFKSKRAMRRGGVW
jgi:hypothetical protein